MSGHRKGSAAEVAAHDRAVRELWANSERERKSGIRDETPAYQRLNARVNELRGPLSPLQRTAAATTLRLSRAARQDRKQSAMRRTIGTRVRDAGHHATRPLRTLTGRLDVGNRRRRRYRETGKGFAVERALRPVRSSLPVYRNRINPATGRPRRDDAEIGRRVDEAFARMRARGITAGRAPVKAQDYAPRRADLIERGQRVVRSEVMENSPERGLKAVRDRAAIAAVQRHVARGHQGGRTR